MKSSKIVLILLLATISNVAVSQSEKSKEKQVEIRPIPYLNYSQSQKFMYGLIGTASFSVAKQDTISPKSTAGVSYIRTTRGSWFGNGFAQLYFNEDKWRIAAMVGTGTYDFQTYLGDIGTEGTFFDYSSDTDIATVRVLHDVHKKNFIGAGVFFNHAVTKFDDLDEELSITNTGLQAIYLHDSRTNVYFPRSGSKSSFILTAYPKSMNDNDSFSIINAYYNQYVENKNEQVWAFRGFVKAGTSDLAFQRQVVMSRLDLRGYVSGKYRGDGKMDVQSEYRHQFGDKIGLVGFAGLGTIYGSDTEEFNWKLYPSAGGGFRYKAIESTGLRVGFDVARGKEDWGLYFRLGEAF